jgi:hypothetical protein
MSSDKNYDNAYGRYLPEGWTKFDSPDDIQVRWQGPQGEVLDVLPLRALGINRWQHRWRLTVLPTHNWAIYGQINGQGHMALQAVLALRTFPTKEEDPR